MDVKALCNNKLHTIKDLVSVLEKGTRTDALTLTVMIKQAEAYLAYWRKQLLEEANSEFIKLQALDPTSNRWRVAGLADVLNFTPKGNWAWPPEVLRLMQALADAQAKAKLEKTASTKKLPPVDPTKMTLFAVSLLDKPEGAGDET